MTQQSFNGCIDRRLREAYDQLHWELVEVHDNLSVPTSSPAMLDYAESPCVTDADEILARLRRSDFSYIDVLAQNGEKWYEFSVSAQVFNDGANERCNLSVSTAGVSIMKKHDPLSWETFCGVVDEVEQALEARLEYRGDDDDQ